MTEERPGRGKNGQFIETLETAERDAQACKLRTAGYSYSQIAEAVGFANEGTAYKAVQRALARVPVEAATEYRVTELERLDVWTREALAVLAADHRVVSHGRVIYGEDGQPLVDHAAKLQALDRLVKLSERRAKLLGMDAPSKISVDAESLLAEITQDIAHLAGGTDGE